MRAFVHFIKIEQRISDILLTQVPISCIVYRFLISYSWCLPVALLCFKSGYSWFLFVLLVDVCKWLHLMFTCGSVWRLQVAPVGVYKWLWLVVLVGVNVYMYCFITVSRFCKFTVSSSWHRLQSQL